MTREEAIEMLKKDKEQRGRCFISDALDMAIKALQVRTEIENTIDQEKLAFGGQFDKGLNMALLIFDKYIKSE